MSTTLTTTEEKGDPLALIENPTPEALQSALAEGNLAKLSLPQRLQFLAAVCKSVGLNPLTQPFEFITFQGKIKLYVKRDATDQLRKMHNVSITIVDRSQLGDIFTVTARATMPTGRCDESIGALPIKGLGGEALAIALMKGETKAKRRVTLSIVGLGFMDESEVEDLQRAEEQMQRQQAYGGQETGPKPHAEGMEIAETTVLPPDDVPPRHWSDLLLNKAYNLVVFPEGSKWAGLQVWEVQKAGSFMDAYRGTPRTDTPERHALDALYFAKLHARFVKKGYDEGTADDALRKTGFLEEGSDMQQMAGDKLEDLATAITDLPDLKAS